MGRHGRRLLLATAIAFPLALVSTAALPVWAEIDGDCSATINGADVAPLSSSDLGDAIQVKQRTAVPVTMQSPNPITGLRIQLEFAGIRWTVHDEPTTGTSWEKRVPVDKYARYGVGLYKVIGQSIGPSGTCSGSALLRVLGNPLTTVVGATAAGVTAVGAAGLMAAGAASVLEGSTSAKISPEGKAAVEALVDVEMRERARLNPWEHWERPHDRSVDMEERRRFHESACFFLVLPALLLTTAAMVGGGPPPEPGPRARLRRVRWRPRVSAVGLMGGLMAGAGAVVLLQQYALVYPTRAVAIEGLVGGLALGLIMPSLMRIFAVRRLNRRIARAERRLIEAQAEKAAPPGSAQG